MHAKHPPWPARTLPAIAVVFAITLAVTAPAIGLYFHADDFEWLRSSQEALSRREGALPADVNGHFRPAPELLWLVETRAFALDARPGHAIALVLHALVAVVVALGAARLTGCSLGGLAAGLFFGVNVATRTVPLWLSASADLLLGLGVALSLAAFSGALRPRILGALGFALALLSKESGLVLPVMVLLITPWMARRNRLRWLLIALTAGLAVPHAVAAFFSTYLGGRFALGTHVPANLLVLLSSLLAPPLGPSAGTLGEPLSWLRLGAGLGALAIVLTLAGRRLGPRVALRFAGALLAALALPALAHGEQEPRWLYVAWIVLAPLAAAAVLELANRVGAVLGRRALVATVALACVLHVLAHGLGLRAKIARDHARDSWVRGVIEGARLRPPPLAQGATIEVLVPFGAELRSWPLGIEMALGQRLDIRPVDDREGPSGAAPVLDATKVPARWLPPAPGVP